MGPYSNHLPFMRGYIKKIQIQIFIMSINRRELKLVRRRYLKKVFRLLGHRGPRKFVFRHPHKFLKIVASPERKIAKRLKTYGYFSTLSFVEKNTILGEKNTILDDQSIEISSESVNNSETLISYLGRLGIKDRIQPREWRDTVSQDEQKKIIKDKMSSVLNDRHEVSVIIPVYNNFVYTLRCVYSMMVSKDTTGFRLIIADDGSEDETESFFSNLEGVTYIKNPNNLGFLRSCNNAARSASGEYILFLNNDTAVLDGWLDRLLEPFEGREDIGVVGSKLIYPDGLLQESGGILWESGACNYGKLADPDSTEYSYLRQVDYVSGASLLTPLNIWNEIGGFDEQYVPAYCEDSDYCLAVRDKGYMVLVQPASHVIHYEGVSNGVDLSSGVKKYQVENTKKLESKWNKLLSANGKSGVKTRDVVDRARGPRLLIIDAEFPTPDQDAASVTMWYFLKIFKQLGYQVTFLPVNLMHMGKYTEDLQAMGVECLYAPYITDIENYLKEFGGGFDIAMLYRVRDGGRYFETVKKYAPQSKVIFDTVDLHFLREKRQAEMEVNVKKSNKIMKRSLKTQERELFLIENSDNSIVLSEYEKQTLLADYGVSNTFVVPIVFEVPGVANTFDNRCNIAFIGGYRHRPNVDAVLYFVEEIWPEVKKRIPGIKFYVIGSMAPPEVIDLCDKDADIVFKGFVEDIDPIFNKIKLTIAPIRYGAGIKGKIGTSLSYGVPCVATDVAAEGMGLTNGLNILTSGDEEGFVKGLVEAYTSYPVWKGLSEHGLEFITEKYSVEAIKLKISDLLRSVGAPV